MLVPFDSLEIRFWSSLNTVSELKNNKHLIATLRTAACRNTLHVHVLPAKLLCTVFDLVSVLQWWQVNCCIASDWHTQPKRTAHPVGRASVRSPRGHWFKSRSSQLFFVQPLNQNALTVCITAFTGHWSRLLGILVSKVYKVNLKLCIVVLTHDRELESKVLFRDSHIMVLPPTFPYLFVLWSKICLHQIFLLFHNLYDSNLNPM